MIRSVPAPGRSGNAFDYRRMFVERAHQLIKMGYDRMTPSACRTEEEPAITGALVEAICEACDDLRSEEWVDFFAAHDDPPVNDGIRKGKCRRRLDIKIVSSERRPRQVFSFEAKRLSKSHSVGAYLGEEGLGRFLEGEYAGDDEDGGMLGYVQSGDRGAWAAKIGQALAATPERYRVLPGDSWQKWRMAEGPDYTYRSRHMRRPLHRKIDVYHTQLSFQ
ncbi:MAG: hypothetical protein GY856_21715 [bacterium]|nr:hypothetical protein [bacterium]